MGTKKPEPISRSFRRDFPEFASRAEILGVGIGLTPKRRGHPRAYWLDGYRQLTGYTTNSDGSPFTDEDAARNIDKALAEVESDRAKIAALSVEERFGRVVADFRKMQPRYRMIGEVRHPGGDSGHCFFMASYEGGVNLYEIGDVAKAEAEWRHGEPSHQQMEKFCRALEDDFKARREAAK